MFISFHHAPLHLVPRQPASVTKYREEESDGSTNFQRQDNIMGNNPDGRRMSSGMRATKINPVVDI